MKIKIDSRKVTDGDTFIAIGKGHSFVDDAIKRGATTVIVESGKYNVNTIKVDDTNKYLEEYLENNYYDDIKDLHLIGITGTNGKTTTAFMIYQALNELDIKCAYIGTLGFYINESIIPTANTTPNLYEIYNMLLMCKEKGIEYVSIEASSQGLDMGRLNTLLFDFSIFTNISQDHLDYHKNIKNYVEAKKKLFKMTRGISIINSDDYYGKEFLINDNSITYGKGDSDYKIEILKSDIYGTNFKLNDEEYYTKLIGEYNVYNMSIVIIILKLLHLDTYIIGQLDAPKGRTDIIKYEDNSIIIDYAHTPDAVLKILECVRNIEHNKIITIIGCGGNRDKLKRPIMGEVAINNSDYVIFTTDNPRFENKRKILRDITRKLDKKNYKIIVNRRKAIKKGIQKLSKNDILLILGKGHEDYQIFKNKKIYFSDKDTVINIIRR